MLGMFEAGLFPGVSYLLSWYVYAQSDVHALFLMHLLLHFLKFTLCTVWHLHLPFLAGISGQNSGFARRYSFQLLQFLVLSEDYWRYVHYKKRRHGFIEMTTRAGGYLKYGRRRRKTSLASLYILCLNCSC